MRALRAAVAAVAASALLSGCNPGAPSFKGADVTGASFGRELALVGHDGKPRTLADFRGKAVAIFFGFTQCPDVCPTALSTAAEAMRRLGPDAARVQVLFVTIDPERDTAELLSRYVPAFHPSFLGLYGDAEATARAAKEFKVVYRKVPGQTPDTYTMDHTAGMYLLDPQGRLRVFESHGQGADALAHDLAELLRTT